MVSGDRFSMRRGIGSRIERMDGRTDLGKMMMNSILDMLSAGREFSVGHFRVLIDSPERKKEITVS